MGEKQQEEKRENGRELYEWVQALVGSVLVVVLVFTFVIRLIGVDGHSMVPTLQDGDRLLVLDPCVTEEAQQRRREAIVHKCEELIRRGVM